MMFVSLGNSQDPPKLAPPEKEHEWLKQLVGEWETDAEAVMEPGKPPIKCKGTDTTRMLGGFWSVSEMKGEMFGTPVVGHLTLGYDAKTKKYVGTWVCSVDGHMWKYEGKVDGKTLTLDTEGPAAPGGKNAKMRDVIELKDADHKVMTSSLLGEDGKWVTFMTMNAKRKK
jgi:hypothetical protein